MGGLRIRKRNIEFLKQVQNSFIVGNEKISSLKSLVYYENISKSSEDTILGTEFKLLREKILIEIKEWEILESKASNLILQYENGDYSLITISQFIIIGIRYGCFVSKFRNIVKSFEQLYEKVTKDNSLVESQNESININIPYQYKLLKITNFLFSSKTQKNIFEPIIGDWQEEYFEALFKKEILKSHWINVRYAYEFIKAMWMKSPFGDLIEFIRKIAS